MICPFCSGTLQTDVDRGVELDRCSHCEALWFDRDELDTYVKGWEQAHAQLAGDIRKTTGTVLICPRCSTTTLQPSTLGTIPAYRCQSCRGVAMTHRQLRVMRRETFAPREWASAGLLGAPALAIAGLLTAIDAVLDVLDRALDRLGRRRRGRRTSA